MSDRINGAFVSFENDIKDEDAETILLALKMVKGVNGVTANTVDADTFIATRRVVRGVVDDLLAIAKKLNEQ